MLCQVNPQLAKNLPAMQEMPVQFLGRANQGIGYPLQYSWASLMAHLVKNPPAMWDTWAWSLGWEDPLEKGKATHSSILAWKFHVHGVAKSWTRLGNLHFHFQVNPLACLYETTDIPEAWTQIQSCFSLSVILRWSFYCLLMTCWALFPVILSVTLVGPSLRFACLVSEASDAFREYFLLTQGAISPTHRKYYHQHSQHSFSANLCPAHHIQGVISFLITQGAYCPHSHFADEETEAWRDSVMSQAHSRT